MEQTGLNKIRLKHEKPNKKWSEKEIQSILDFLQEAPEVKVKFVIKYVDCIYEHFYLAVFITAYSFDSQNKRQYLFNSADMRYSQWNPKFIRGNKYLLKFSSISNAESKPHLFETHLTVRSEKTYNKSDLPIEFKVSSESLLHLAARVVDALPLPDVYRWTNGDVCNWLKCFGYPHYEHTFRTNLITGRKLLLIDVNALCAMNIKNFSDIKRLAKGIRQLFYFEMIKFTRSISLPPQHHYELYKLFQTKSGYAHLKRSDLWCQLKLLRKKSKYPCHWDIIEHWLSRETRDRELFGAQN